MRFVCDVMLGKLARYLRVFGIDAVYAKTGAEFERYVDAGEGQTFYLLTRRSRVKHGDRTLFVRSDRPREQLREIWHIVSPLVDPDTVMARCIECNVPLVHVSREDIEQYVPEFVFHRYKEFQKMSGVRKGLLGGFPCLSDVPVHKGGYCWRRLGASRELKI